MSGVRSIIHRLLRLRSCRGRALDEAPDEEEAEPVEHRLAADVPAAGECEDGGDCDYDGVPRQEMHTPGGRQAHKDQNYAHDAFHHVEDNGYGHRAVIVAI